MTFTRGFKASCERLVGDVRTEMAVAEEHPIDMHALANHLEIPVYPLSDIVSISLDPLRDALLAEIYKSVSAFTVFEGARRTIVYNDEHQFPRHRSNMAHELAHALLLHPPENSGLGVTQEALHEREAAWLSGVLMLTANQAKTIATRRMSQRQAEDVFQLSAEMLRFRLNVTGAARLLRA